MSPYIIADWAFYWKFPDEAARTACTTLLNEVNRLALQEDDGSLWVLQGDLSWSQVGGSGGGAGGWTDKQRRTFLVDCIYQSKSLASVFVAIELLADGYKNTDGIDAGSSSTYTVDTTNGKVSPGLSGTLVTLNTADTTANYGTGYTIFVRTAALVAGDVIYSIGVYNTTAVINQIVKIGLRTAAGTYTIILNEVFNHPGTGWYDVTLSTPYTVPGTGTYYAGAFISGNYSVSTSAARAYKIGNISTGSNSGFTEDTANPGSIRYTKNASIGNMTVVSSELTTVDSATKLRILVEYDPIDVITLNTDLILELSCDGGTTWQGAIVTSQGIGKDGHFIAESSLVTCVAGTALAYKLSTLNNKAVDIYGVVACGDTGVGSAPETGLEFPFYSSTGAADNIALV